MNWVARLLWVLAFCGMLAVWSLATAQSYWTRTAKDMDTLHRALVTPSPVGGFGAEVNRRWLSLAATAEQFKAGLQHVPEAGPDRTALLVIINVRTRGGACDQLLSWAPLRRDVQEMCLTREGYRPIFPSEEGE